MNDRPNHRISQVVPVVSVGEVRNGNRPWARISNAAVFAERRVAGGHTFTVAEDSQGGVVEIGRDQTELGEDAHSVPGSYFLFRSKHSARPLSSGLSVPRAVVA